MKKGTVKKCKKISINQLRHWLQLTKKSLPEGSIVIQSTTGYNLPYPGNLFKRGTWSVIDLFFFLPDIPITFCDEEKGKTFKIKSLDRFYSIN